MTKNVNKQKNCIVARIPYGKLTHSTWKYKGENCKLQVTGKKNENSRKRMWSISE
jgi:hypothetical protein